MGHPPDRPHRQVQRETILVPEAEAEAPPVLGIFQPSFQLTHEDFVTIQSASRFWNGLGGVLCTFSVAYVLPKMIAQIKSAIKIEPTDWWITGIIFVLGLVCFGASRFFSSARRAVLTRINQFFKDNPGQPEYRPGRR